MAEKRIPISLRLPAELHAALAVAAEQERRSLNAQIVKALEEWLAARHPK